MRKWIIAAAAVTLVTIVPVSRHYARAATPPLATAQQKAEAHPHIRAAIRELKGARTELQTAAHDFGGHKAAAISAVDAAISQLQQALAYDKK